MHIAHQKTKKLFIFNKLHNFNSFTVLLIFRTSREQFLICKEAKSKNRPQITHQKTHLYAHRVCKTGKFAYSNTKYTPNFVSDMQ